MIVFATSDKGGTGRSVTTINIAYRAAVRGSDVCYLDFDFGSPTAGAIFGIEASDRGTTGGRGLHSYFAGRSAEAEQIELWAEPGWKGRRPRPGGAGRLALLPGDQGGGEFPVDKAMVSRCRDLLLMLDEEFDLILVDLSAGRSYAAQMVLAATGLPEMRGADVRWLVFHRWTRQHIIAAHGLVFGEKGIIDTGSRHGHDRETLGDTIKFVRTAVVEPDSAYLLGLRPAQLAWLQNCNEHLQDLAAGRGLGRSAVLGSVPLDPVLQWREQIVMDGDIQHTKIANPETGDAFDNLARRLTDGRPWEGR
jgi:hypothetical protein